MRYYYDLHIHSALSPCGEEEMTPCNIVQMAALSGLNIIAMTDHNTCGNAEALMRAADRLTNVLVLPGMELETEEAIHVLMLFDNLESAKACEQIVNENRLNIRNKPEIYGRQLYMNDFDEIVKTEENLLVVSTAIDLESARQLAIRFGGVAIPAHVDKPSNAVIAILGDLTPEMGFFTAELSRHADEALKQKLTQQGYLILRNSDAHRLEDINEQDTNFLELDSLSATAVIRALRNKKTDG